MMVFGFGADGTLLQITRGEEVTIRATAALHPDVEFFIADGSRFVGVVMRIDPAAPTIDQARAELTPLASA